ncbi:MAG: DNA translocase FtsK [Gracilibacteraceae bacterium]|jgi:DNA segregation ATPase FtsK/SpoIIIE-like protein|nr:DNA translocase FtsK [Gracilibacteraceae bacterium]
MRKLLALLTAVPLAAVAGAYGLGSAEAGDLFIDFYILLHDALGSFAVALPALCLVLAVAVLILGWRSGADQARAWPEREEESAPPIAPTAAPAGNNDWLFQPLADSGDQFSRYFAEELLVGTETAGQKRRKKFYARFGENFSTYFGEGGPSLAPVTRTVRVHGFQRYFDDLDYLVSRRKKRVAARKEEKEERQERQERQGSEPSLVWYGTPPPLAQMTETGQAAAPPPSPPPPPPPSSAPSPPRPSSPSPPPSSPPLSSSPSLPSSAPSPPLPSSPPPADGTPRTAKPLLRVMPGGAAEENKTRRSALNAASYVPEQYTASRFPARRQWVLPGLLLLDRPALSQMAPDIVEPERLEEIFAGYGVSVSVNHVTVGPVVTQYEVVPHTGTKIRKIESLSDDVALSLAAPGGVRIEMIPGRGAMGVEVPNKSFDTVYFSQIVQSARFSEKKSLLRVALGKDIADKPIVAELNRMPHLLVAGATGSGKSIFINCLINSILFSATPNEARLVLIDPKMVELSQYSGIPHLLAPVVTDAKKAAAALRFLVREMESRYELFAHRKVRDIDGYNAALAPNEVRLPYIIVIIDEMADLMMAAANDIEELVCRLAQMARAAGMHLVLATQRPSVNVITGLIKANIPARISFAVSSQIDSRTIIDTPGAEKLLGRGDMLFLPQGLSRPLRVHGCYISEAEIRRVTEHWLAQGKPQYLIGENELAEEENADNTQSAERDGAGDEKFFQAGMLVITIGRASTTFLQTKLRVGYSRAARLMDLLEMEGVISPGEGGKPREILMSREKFEELFA